MALNRAAKFSLCVCKFTDETLGSTKIKASPALTFCPSFTKIFETMPFSSGFKILISPFGITLPLALTTISTFAKMLQRTKNISERVTI